MKSLNYLILFIFLLNCSFDNKSGIWDSSNNTISKNDNLFKDFKTLSIKKESFKQTIDIKKNFQFILDKTINNSEWKDIFFNKENNFSNFSYNDINKLRFRSKKLSRYELSDYLVSENKHIVTSDKKGNLIIFSLEKGKVVSKYNFYKNKYKNIKKILNFSIDKGIIYISDNLGYLYAFDIKNNKIIWAKDLKIPFRSNLKIIKGMIVVASQNNNLFFFDKKGNQLALIPTEETIVKNQFINNISSNDENLFFLNTYGSIYAIDNRNLKIKWFLNLNQSINLNTSNQFLGSEIINHKKFVITSSEKFTYVIDSSSGVIMYKKEFSSKIKPVAFGKYLFLLTKNDFLVCLDLDVGKILYSYDVNDRIAEFLGTKKKKVKFKNFMIVNSQIFIFLNNSYVLKFSIDGKLKKIEKLPTRLLSNPIILDKSIFYADSNHKLSIVD